MEPLWNEAARLEGELTRISLKVEREHDPYEPTRCTYRAYEPVDLVQLDDLMEATLAIDPQSRSHRGGHWEVRVIVRVFYRKLRPFKPMVEREPGHWFYDLGTVEETSPHP